MEELFVMPFPFICRELEEQEAESEMLNHHFDCKPPFILSHTLPPSLPPLAPSKRAATMPEGSLRKDKKDKRTSWWPW